MIWRKVIPILILSSYLSLSAQAQKVFPSPSTIRPSSTLEHTQDFSETVVPITSVRLTPSAKLGITGKLGPKACSDCSLDRSSSHQALCTAEREQLRKPVAPASPQSIEDRFDSGF
jgi:hypothetical protein